MDLDLGLLILRIALGPMLVAHGLNKVRGPGGLAGTAAWFEGLGMRPGRLHARLAAATELLAGALMTIGLGTGLAAAAYVGLMVVATLTDHRGKGYFVFKGGCEYTALIAISAVAVAASGPGAWSVDHALSVTVSGWVWALIAAVGGGASAVILLVAARRPLTPP